MSDARRIGAEALGSALLTGTVVGSGVLASRLSAGNDSVDQRNCHQCYHPQHDQVLPDPEVVHSRIQSWKTLDDEGRCYLDQSLVR